jgi:hypothetical protein
MGYARAKLAEASGPLPNVGLLRNARKDFRECRRLDPDHHKAGRALERLDKLIPTRPQSVLEHGGRLLVAFLCVIVFGLVVGSVFFGWPADDLDAGVDTSVLVFGSLLFLMAGLYLPQVLKLKVAGIELEKSAPEQVTTTAITITGEARLIARLSWSPTQLPSSRASRPVQRSPASVVAAAKPQPGRPPSPERKTSGEIQLPKDAGAADYRPLPPAEPGVVTG